MAKSGTSGARSRSRSNGNGSRTHNGNGQSRSSRDSGTSEVDNDVLAMLKAQHRQVEQLFSAIENAGDTRRKSALFDELLEALVVHAAIEEEHFYPAIRASETEDLVEESYEEHMSMKRLLADLIDLSPGDETFDAKIAKLKEEVHHHAVEEEEGKLFPKVEKLIDRDQRMALAQLLTSAIVELQEEGEPQRRLEQEVESATIQ